MDDTQVMNRRAALGLLLGGVAVATTITLIPNEAEALELPKLDLPKLDTAEGGDGLVQNIHWRRRRRWRRCWRNRWGRLVCRW